MKTGTRYLLDTNTVAYVLSGRSRIARRRLEGLREDDVACISSITEGEIRYGLARKPAAARLREAVEDFLAAVEILPWDSECARVYGEMRADLTSSGRTLSAMDLLIAAHAASVEATLVTSDKAFRFVKDYVEVVDWATDV
ncbi:MAG TPA: type II toxin-antitoxin system VapC family toxin [Edaphobacter sp.]|nr:type II toxin-antitoxin system VapC family toxin [Edaphobacter sp.]